jgi:hypothetical protein
MKLACHVLVLIFWVAVDKYLYLVLRKLFSLEIKGIEPRLQANSLERHHRIDRKRFEGNRSDHDLAFSVVE